MNIFVGNLSFEVKEIDVQRAFMAFGVVTSVAIVLEKKGKKSRGFGFVEMPDEAEALAAIAQLQGKAILGRPINVMAALSKEPKQPSVAPEDKSGLNFKRTGKYKEGRRTFSYLKKRLDAGITAPVRESRHKSNPMRWLKKPRTQASFTKPEGDLKPWQRPQTESNPWKKPLAKSASWQRSEGAASRPWKKSTSEAKPWQRSEGAASRPWKKSTSEAKPWQKSGSEAKPWQKSGSDSKPWEKSRGGSSPWKKTASEAKPWQKSAGEAKPWKKSGSESKPWEKSRGGAKPWRKTAGARQQPNFKKRSDSVKHKK